MEHINKGLIKGLRDCKFKQRLWPRLRLNGDSVISSVLKLSMSKLTKPRI